MKTKVYYVGMALGKVNWKKQYNRTLSVIHVNHILHFIILYNAVYYLAGWIQILIPIFTRQLHYKPIVGYF